MVLPVRRARAVSERSVDLYGVPTPSCRPLRQHRSSTKPSESTRTTPPRLVEVQALLDRLPTAPNLPSRAVSRSPVAVLLLSILIIDSNSCVHPSLGALADDVEAPRGVVECVGRVLRLLTVLKVELRSERADRAKLDEDSDAGSLSPSQTKEQRVQLSRCDIY
jgi:hypothetical protein